MEREFRILAFVAGATPAGRRTIDALHAMATDEGLEPDVIDIVDVLDRPTLAEEHRVVATPTVIRLAPTPTVRIVGDLSAPGHRDDVLLLLFR